ncbi:MAG: hypothetical protein MOGMAGMI_00145 [Candidatus Omnitrophica bacterium]|nr:hypothetical protein [Candidatus Omnitrophota bacterium]
MPKSDRSFYFRTELALVFMTGRKAHDLRELYEGIRAVPEASIYHHTHHSLQWPGDLSEPTNDFADWVRQVLKNEPVAEKLAAVDVYRYHTLKDLREALAAVLEPVLESEPKGAAREAGSGEEFVFLTSSLYNIPTPYTAKDLREFSDCLRKVSVQSLYYHIFEALLRPPLGTNDFSDWLSGCLDERELAERISRLDPYSHSMEALRARILEEVERRLGATVPDAGS